MDEREPIIVTAVTPPFGSFMESLKDVLHIKLAALIMDDVCKRAKSHKKDISYIYWSVVIVRSDGNGMAWSAVLKAGISDYVLAVQVNRACYSSMEAIKNCLHGHSAG